MILTHHHAGKAKKEYYLRKDQVMKILKKIICGLVTASVLVANSLIMTANAYDSCDFNHDNVVNVRDSAILKKYLAGNLKVDDIADIKMFDVNKNLTIDAMDEQYVVSKYMGWSYSSQYYSRKLNKKYPNPNVNGNVCYMDDTATEARVYKVFSYDDWTTEEYTLTPSSVGIQYAESNLLRSPIREEDREPANGSENEGLVLLTNGTFRATGFIVGDHQIATAGHCVMNIDDAGNKSWRTTMSILTYNKNGRLSGNKLTAVKAHVPQLFVDAKNRTTEMPKYDYALITVKEDLSKYYHFNLGTSYNTTKSSYKNIPIYVTGRPKSVNPNREHGIIDNSTDLRLYSGEGRIVESDIETGALIKLDVNASVGQSGSPVYTVTKNIINNKSSEFCTVLGIYSSLGKQSNNELCNQGPAITKYLLQFYKNNPYVNA